MQRHHSLTLSLVPFLVASVNAEIITVPGDYPTIQEAINAAVQLDTIVVSPGIYQENIHYQAKLITITSVDPTDPDTVVSTIIDAGGNGNTVTFSGVEDSNAALIGFTITNAGQHGIAGSGCTAGISFCNVIENGQRGVSECDGEISDCTISDNSAFGIAACDGLITRCMVSGNTQGLTDCQGVIDNDTIFENTLNGLINCNGTISRCTVRGNVDNGFSGCDADILNCVISGNFDHGISGNNFHAIRNCTITGNGDYGIASVGGEPAISNCIIWDNALGSLISAPLPAYSCIQGGSDGEGNISANPLFVTPGFWQGGVWVEGDYHLLSFSPAVNAGDPDFDEVETDLDGLTRIIDGRVDMGAYESDAECSGADFDGDGTPDECDPDIDGDGVPNGEDACDFTPSGAPIQPNGTLLADLDGDCDVDLFDFAIMQLEFTGPN